MISPVTQVLLWDNSHDPGPASQTDSLDIDLNKVFIALGSTSQPSSSSKIDNSFTTDSHRQWYPIVNCEFLHWLISFSNLKRGSEWHLEYLQLYRRYHCRLPLRKGREETFIPDFNHGSIFFQSPALSLYWIVPLLIILSGMFVFWTLQTACFALYSTSGNTQAAHTVIAMICTSTLCLSSLLIDINLLLCYWSFVLRFLWVHFGIFFAL